MHVQKAEMLARNAHLMPPLFFQCGLHVPHFNLSDVFADKKIPNQYLGSQLIHYFRNTGQGQHCLRLYKPSIPLLLRAGYREAELRTILDFFSESDRDESSTSMINKS